MLVWTHKFGSSPEKKKIFPDRYKAGPISSIYVMQDEMTQLRTENESLQGKSLINNNLKLMH